MRKLSDYFKTVAGAQTPSTGRSMQMSDDDDDSPLSDCVSMASPTPPPPRKIIQPSKLARGAIGTGTSQGLKQTSDTISTRAGVSSASALSKNKAASVNHARAVHGNTKAVIPDSEGDETDGSMEDLDLLLQPKAAKATKFERKAGRKRKTTELPLSPKKPAPDTTLRTYTFSLDALLSQKAKDAEREQTLKRTEALLAGAGEDADHVHLPRKLADKGIVDAVVGNDTGSKVLDMLNRREAWRVDYTWYFFDRSKGNARSRARSAFPTDSLQGWSSELKDPSTRCQMFVSGYVRDMCIICPALSREVVSWLLDELVLETREDLSFAYARTLEVCQTQVQQLLDCTRISALFELLGARKDAVDPRIPVTMEVASSGKAKRVKNEDIWSLKLLVKFIGNIAAHLSNAVIQTATSTLIRLSFDDMFTKYGDLLIDVEQSIYSLLMSRIESSGETSWEKASFELFQTLFTTFTEPSAQSRLLKNLPLSSPRTHLFRRRLALTFLFNDPKYFTLPTSQLVAVSDFSRILGKQQFSIKRDTDYGKLKALIEILDIAFDDGGEHGADHNKHVERVASALKDISSRIRDTGMASLERTEAKQVIELTQFRLQFTVAKGANCFSVLEQHFLKDDFGDKEGKKQTILKFNGSKKAGNNNEASIL